MRKTKERKWDRWHFLPVVTRVWTWRWKLQREGGVPGALVNEQTWDLFVPIFLTTVDARQQTARESGRLRGPTQNINSGSTSLVSLRGDAEKQLRYSKTTCAIGDDLIHTLTHTYKLCFPGSLLFVRTPLNAVCLHLVPQQRFRDFRLRYSVRCRRMSTQETAGSLRFFTSRCDVKRWFVRPKHPGIILEHPGTSWEVRGIERLFHRSEFWGWKKD